MKFDFLIIGAGFAGSVVAERLADAGKKILILDKRCHIGGNAYDELDNHQILVHRYGPHIFHTNSEKIFSYLSNFTKWRPYEHRVLASVEGKLLPIPINLDTINKLYNLSLDENGLKEFFLNVREPRDPIKTSEDVVINAVGRDLYEKFYKGYTRKQWGLDPCQLNASVTARIPIRTNQDDRYFTDKYQVMPSDGYTQMFKRLLAHKNIMVELDCDFNKMNGKVTRDFTIYTGPIDAYYEFEFGKLPYRSLYFEHEHHSTQENFQSVGTVNFPNDHQYTRITEFKHLTGQKHPRTSIVKEYPRSDGDPYYPIPTNENDLLYKRYAALASKEKSTFFIGRLARYRYYNMDQVVGAALTFSENFLRTKNKEDLKLV